MSFFARNSGVTRSVFGLIGGLCLSVSATAETQILDRIAAIVEEDVVMESELRERLAMVKDNMRSRGVTSFPEDDELRRTVLDRLILDSLQLQIAVRAGVVIDDGRLNRSLAAIAQQNGLSLQDFQQRYESEGGNFLALRENLRRDLLLQQVQRGNVNHRVQITEDEIDNFLESEEGKVLTARDYRIDHILLPIASDASAGDIAIANELMEETRGKAMAGASFAELASAETRLNHSDLGWRKEAQVPGIFIEPVKSLNVGDIAEPIRSPSGLHLIKLAERRGGETQMVAQTQARHILLKLSEVSSDARTKERADELYRQIQGGADFAELAKEHSEDIGSASQGGDLGWMGPGELVPEFEQVMNNTALNDVSEPFRSQFGWHILQVMDRRDHDVTEQVLRNRVRGVIHNRKYADELEIWMQKTRDEAYVDIKI